MQALRTRAPTYHGPFVHAGPVREQIPARLRTAGGHATARAPCAAIQIPRKSTAALVAYRATAESLVHVQSNSEGARAGTMPRPSTRCALAFAVCAPPRQSHARRGCPRFRTKCVASSSGCGSCWAKPGTGTSLKRRPGPMSSARRVTKPGRRRLSRRLFRRFAIRVIEHFGARWTAGDSRASCWRSDGSTRCSGRRCRAMPGSAPRSNWRDSYYRDVRSASRTLISPDCRARSAIGFASTRRSCDISPNSSPDVTRRGRPADICAGSPLFKTSARGVRTTLQ